MTIQQILIPALCLFLLANAIVGYSLMVMSGRLSEYDRRREERERHERIGRGFGEAEITQLRRVDGEKKWKARVGE